MIIWGGGIDNKRKSATERCIVTESALVWGRISLIGVISRALRGPKEDLYPFLSPP